ncbi:hypothetical protein JCM10450v2_003227 [Rhodotorula kratochvilovae]
MAAPALLAVPALAAPLSASVIELREEIANDQGNVALPVSALTLDRITKVEHILAAEAAACFESTDAQADQIRNAWRDWIQFNAAAIDLLPQPGQGASGIQHAFGVEVQQQATHQLALSVETQLQQLAARHFNCFHQPWRGVPNNAGDMPPGPSGSPLHPIGGPALPPFTSRADILALSPADLASWLAFYSLPASGRTAEDHDALYIRLRALPLSI